MLLTRTYARRMTAGCKAPGAALRPQAQEPSDGADPEAVRELVETTVTAYGRLDGVVLNAGIGQGGAVGDTTVEDWEELIRTNLTGPFLLLRAAL
ncbi:SDR family NAD(P)-dependent oxidoreductase, partial [Streptomyces decoyicus]|uniref:SDR family NAD(P)-dependent oxidoreductase n=1 Tax=Streptomyces decoyicus TaxID=249567 RepID=UPI003F4CC009